MFTKFARSPVQNWLLLSTILLSILLQFPQPQLDLEYYTSLASDYTSSTNADAPLEGVKIVVTGATSGLGLSLTKMLHNLGGTIIVIGRNQSKLAKLESELEYGDDTDGASNKSKRQHNRIITILADFQDMDSVSTAADAIRSKFKTIDMLINNAGMVYPYGGSGESSTPQGYDTVFSVNYLSHFLLTEKLLPSLKRSKLTNGSRIIQIASSSHFLVNGDDLVPTTTMDNKAVRPLASQPSTASYGHRVKSYGNSKLAQIYHMRSLARELESSENNVKVVSLCPSLVATNIMGSTKKQILDLLAFQSDGFGVAPILFAMFHPYAGLMGDDYVDNCNKGLLGLNLITYVPDTVKKYFLDPGLLNLAMFQKFVSGVHFFKSSPDSYDVVKRDALYKWSKEAVETWMK